MCGSHATVRGLLSELVASATDVCVADMEAGLEHLSRGTAGKADVLVAVIEPYYRSLETGARVVDLGKELGISRLITVANKVRNDDDRQAIERFCASRGLALDAVLPHDEAVLSADREGRAVLDASPGCSYVRCVEGVASSIAH
jgi:CO dehydrogenase maturation factor